MHNTIISHFTDNDLYKFTTMNAVQKLYPHARVKYRFFDRNATQFPAGFGEALKAEVSTMASLSLSAEEECFIRQRCYYFDPVFIDLLKGYRYDPSEVSIQQRGDELDIVVEGLWYRTVLWEVPLMAMISELYFRMTGQQAGEVESTAFEKGVRFKALAANYSDFGTRRRFSFEVHDKVIRTLKESSGGHLRGTSNVYLAMKHQLPPIGTHPHEWFMYHGAHYGYRMANAKSLESWTKVYHGDLGIALTDTYTTDNFYENFTTEYAKLFDGVRWDSGDPIEFTEKTLAFYRTRRIRPETKTVVYSDALNLDKVAQIRKFVDGRLIDVYGIGTYLTNDVGVTPLNMVIKMTHAKRNGEQDYVETVKLSDVKGKHTGALREIEFCKASLGIE
ncbi:MAG: nicotinate phosphoribosyltransferase [Marinilabiliaceae bacterium]|nr:nicotinate phosphoribosyltransferase [Marinilabiliaceae bacterium]